MRLISTRGEAEPVAFTDAVVAGTAPDGGLWMPERLPRLPPERLEDVLELPWPRLAAALAGELLAGELPPEELDSLVTEALDFPIPLVEVAPGRFVLELFHGPTLAFKDVGARFLARLLSRLQLAGRRRDERPLVVLAATSGDTGSAVAHAFYRVPATRVFVLYPRGQVSEAQRRLFTTLGANVTALEVDGVFDDCQRLVKGAFADPALGEALALVSANSINIGRLLPQSFYYFQAVAELRRRGEGRAPIVSVPSGNFGNVGAGLLARRLGLPVARFVAATNVNDAVARFLDTGHYSPRPSRSTLSNAMDVGDPSNLARIRHLYDDDLEALRDDLDSRSFDDATTLEAIARVERDHGYLLDPHTAVGWLGLESVGSPSPPGIVLATAHPAKFADIVERAVGHGIELPPALAEAFAREETIEPIPADADVFRRRLLGATVAS